MNGSRPVLVMVAALTALPASPQTRQDLPDEVVPFTIRSERRSLTLSAEDNWLIGETAGPQTASQDGQYRQSIEMDFYGSVYHPNLMTYVLDSRLGVSQWQSGTPEEPPSVGLIADVHFLSTFLREKPYPFGFQFDRHDGFQKYSVFDRARVTETALGGDARLKNDVIPLQVSVRQSWKDEEQENRASSQDALVLRAGVDNTSTDSDHIVRADYTYSDFDRQTRGLFTHQGVSHEARLSDSLKLGDGNRLSSTLHYLNMTGTIREDAADVAEHIQVSLPWRLNGQASYGLHGVWNSPEESVANSGRVQLSHQLYESLTSTLGLDASLTTASAYRQTTLGPDLDLRYRKQIPIGRLTLDYRLDTQLEDREVDARTVSIVDERHVLEDGVVTLLDFPRVDRLSIFVTDESGTQVYLVDIDYMVTEIAGRTQLRRIPGRGIPDAGRVLVDYAVTSDPSFRSFLLSHSAGLRCDLFDQKLALYYRYRSQRYPYSVAAEALSLDAVDDHVVGLALNLPPLACSAEYEHHGSSILPYDALRAQQDLSLPVAERSLIALQGVESLTHFSATDLSQGFVEVVARYSVSPAESLALSLAGGYRLQTETDTDARSLWSAQAGLDFRRGLLQAAARYEFLGAIIEGNQDHSLLLSLTRQF
jgi:hypothetical protein